MTSQIRSDQVSHPTVASCTNPEHQNSNISSFCFTAGLRTLNNQSLPLLDKAVPALDCLGPWKVKLLDVVIIISILQTRHSPFRQKHAVNEEDQRDLSAQTSSTVAEWRHKRGCMCATASKHLSQSLIAFDANHKNFRVRPENLNILSLKPSKTCYTQILTTRMDQKRSAKELRTATILTSVLLSTRHTLHLPLEKNICKSVTLVALLSFFVLAWHLHRCKSMCTG